MELITIQGKVYAAGLYWQTLSGVTPLLRAAREAAAQIDEGTQGKTSYNAAVLRHKDRQAGFAETVGPIKPAPSLAALLAESNALLKGPSDGWIARLRIPGQSMLVMAAIGGSVLPDGDFVGSEEHALERMNNLKETYGNKLSEIIEEDSPEVAITKLTDWLSAAPKKNIAKLRTLKPTNPIVKIGISLAGAAALLFIGLYVHSYIQAQHLQEEVKAAAIARERMSAEMKMESMQQEQEAALGPNVLPINVFLSNCYTAFLRTPIASHGWVLSSWICDGIATTETWRYQPGASMLHLPDHAVLNPMTPGVVTGSLLLDRNARKSKMALSHSKTESMGQFFSLAKYVGADDVSFQWIPQPMPAPGSKTPAIIGPDQSNWNLAMHGISPFDIVGSLNNIRGLTLKQVVFKTMGANQTWQVEGSIYATH